ncbi:esterase/lipase family protein [Phycicoccus duodecadis]|uniref:Triacylglycerol esterase/lipase EstA (Alpha/beta hydrolase family) n=1 Tax=Phycicoccus duodecadis TaxID=173053 RepID=A0A2N3YKH3_9MICO|nr:alpha/beta fold hydrolase [Phycicoccus duodecadis]PKW27357.1 triacylglycerol esterase/lipase EstA (alpha/beta hydrolase family) [Phycicoccus duodecadis]
MATRPLTPVPGPAPRQQPGAVRLSGAVRATARAARALADPAVLAGAAVEAAWLGAHVATWPLGLVIGAGRADAPAYRVEHLPPVQRGLLVSDIEAAGTPILLVHGIVSNRSIFILLRRGLTRRGFSRVFAMNYSTVSTDVRAAALRLAEEVERIVEETGYERLHVIGHSLGGLIARYYVTRLGGDARVHTLVTLGTPHEGTWAAYALPTHLMRQMRPGSGLMRELADPVPGTRTRFISYWSDADAAIVPQRSAALRHRDLGARNVRLHGAGHLTLPMLGDVVHGISAALAQLDAQGGTTRRGATPLSRRD